MHDRLVDYSSTRKLPTGRRIFAMQAARRVSDGYGDTALVDKCQSAIDLDRQTLNLELRYREQKSTVTSARGDAAALDAKIDDRLSRMYSVAQSQAVGDDEVARLAAAFVAQVFPDGLAGVVHQNFEGQLATMDHLLERFDDDLAEHVDKVGLRRHVDALQTLVPAFRAELEKENRQQVSYDDVKAARARGLDKFAGALFAVLSTYDDSSDPQHVERREAILAEYHRQNTIVSDSYRRNKTVEDIDPDTGEPAVSDDETDEDVVEPVA